MSNCWEFIKTFTAAQVKRLNGEKPHIFLEITHTSSNKNERRNVSSSADDWKSVNEKSWGEFRHVKNISRFKIIDRNEHDVILSYYSSTAQGDPKEKSLSSSGENDKW